MLKANVPPSWVKRVLEVDGKDAQVLDLDSDRTLADQLLFGAADEFGNVDWDKVSLPKRSDSNGNLLAANDIIPAAADTFGSVRAEFAQPVMGKDVVEKQKIVEAEKEKTMPPAPLGGQSKHRRELLKKNEKPLITITGYYAAADSVFAQFKSHLANSRGRNLHSSRRFSSQVMRTTIPPNQN